MKRLKQIPTIVPYHNGKVSVGSKDFTIKDGTQGRTMLTEFLVEDEKLPEKIEKNEALNTIRNTVLAQTVITTDPSTKKRLIPSSSNFFGGSVYSFDKTPEGFYLIVLRNTDGGNDGKYFPSENIGGVIVPDISVVTNDGKKLLEEANLLTEEELLPFEEPKEVPEEEFKPVDAGKLAEVISKTTELVNNKLQNRERRVSKPV